jgi:hypothetical protein
MIEMMKTKKNTVPALTRVSGPPASHGIMGNAILSEHVLSLINRSFFNSASGIQVSFPYFSGVSTISFNLAVSILLEEFRGNSGMKKTFFGTLYEGSRVLQWESTSPRRTP